MTVSKTVKIVIGAVAAVVILGGAGVWYFVLRDDAPKQASLDAIAPQSGAASSTTGAPRATPDGSWKVVKSDSVFVGYRMQELFGGETVKKTAAGRTGDVTGTMTIQGTTIPTVEVKADVTTLKSDQPRRDGAIKNQGLETAKFGTAEFKLTQPIQLPSAPKAGEEITVTAKGDLTLHGQTKSVEVQLQAKWDGAGNITVAGNAPIQLADYGITPINIPFVATDDHGSMEFQLLFQPA